MCGALFLAVHIYQFYTQIKILANSRHWRAAYFGNVHAYNDGIGAVTFFCSPGQPAGPVNETKDRDGTALFNCNGYYFNLARLGDCIRRTCIFPEPRMDTQAVR